MTASTAATSLSSEAFQRLSAYSFFQVLPTQLQSAVGYLDETALSHVPGYQFLTTSTLNVAEKAVLIAKPSLDKIVKSTQIESFAEAGLQRLEALSTAYLPSETETDQDSPKEIESLTLSERAIILVKRVVNAAVSSAESVPRRIVAHLAMKQSFSMFVVSAKTGAQNAVTLAKHYLVSIWRQLIWFSQHSMSKVFEWAGVQLNLLRSKVPSLSEALMWLDATLHQVLLKVHPSIADRVRPFITIKFKSS